MNAPIIDPLQGDFPEVIEEYLEHGIMKCIAFNRRGTLLAAGCSDGSCVIWDFETRGIAKELRDKDCVAAITSVCWSKNGHNILISAADKSLILWNVLKGEKIYQTTLQQTPLQARLHPSEPTICLVCPFSSAPMIVDLSTQNTKTLPISFSGLNPPSKNKFLDGSSAHYTPTAACFNRYGDLVYVGNSVGEIIIIDHKNNKILGIVPISSGSVVKNIIFSRDGRYLLTNSSDRTIRIYENLLPFKNSLKDETFDGFEALNASQLKDSLKDENPNGIEALNASRSKDSLKDSNPNGVESLKASQLKALLKDETLNGIESLNASGLKDSLNDSTPHEVESLKASQLKDSLKDSTPDGIESLKAFGSKCLSLFREFQDSVTRVHWKAPCFSGDGEWVVGGSASKGEHKIYIWDRGGNLVKILEGPKEALMDLAWHPLHPIVVSVSLTGLVYIWAKDYTENWSAFAPDFKELEENEEYVEREDEFDLMPETEKVKESETNEDVDVDIITVEKDSGFSDSDISQEELRFLPADPCPDVPEPQDRHVGDSKNSGSPLSEETAMNHDSNQNEGVENSGGEEIGGGTHLKRRRKPSEKVLELQAHKVRKPLQQKTTKGSAKSSKTKSKFGIEQEHDFSHFADDNGIDD